METRSKAQQNNIFQKKKQKKSNNSLTDANNDILFNLRNGNKLCTRTIDTAIIYFNDLFRKTINKKKY